MYSQMCFISGFCREVDESSALLGNLLRNNPYEDSYQQNMQFVANLKSPKIGQGFFSSYYSTGVRA
jgi:hypothetical protein